MRSVPKDVGRNLRWRRDLLKECQKRPQLRHGVWAACRDDILFYVNGFCWTYDPRPKPAAPIDSFFLPFITYGYQDEAIHAILDAVRDGRDLVIEKSRDMGASWISLLVMEWLWHFHAGNSFLMVSRVGDLVDAPGDPDSLFWKIDFLHRHQPAWLMPRFERRRNHFSNLDHESTIDGVATTGAAGVGGRRTAMFVDEFSRIDEGHLLLAGTADTTRCRIFNFTPFGTSNAAYKLARREDIKKLRLHWSQHPEKARGLYRYSEVTRKVEILDKSFHYPEDFHFVMDGRLRSPWYDEECRRRANDREVAQMLDIDYHGSSYQFFDRNLIVDLQRSYGADPDWEGALQYDETTARPVSLIHGAGQLKMWLTPSKDDKPPTSVYAIGVDVAAGTGSTNSCISVMDCRTGERVAEVADPYIRSDKLGDLAVALSWFFVGAEGEPATIAWEHAGPGVVFGKRVLELGARNIYYRKGVTNLPGVKASDQPGWIPTADSTRVILERYRAALASRRCLNRSVAALEECLSFIHTPAGKIEHAEQSGTDDPTGARMNHGDRVIADALAWMMVEEAGVSRYGTDPFMSTQVGSLAWRRQIHDNNRQLATAW